jgi:manganese transport protein
MNDKTEYKNIKSGDIGTVKAATDVLSGRKSKGRLGRLLPFLGPAFIASVAYVDPGNFATNIQGGSMFGYKLLWVVVASNLMAMLIQTLSAKLGIATGYNLAEHCRIRFSRPTVYAMWVLMEIVAMATDLAEFLGAALGFNLLLGIPLWIGGILTAISTFLILSLERYGFRPLEAVITTMVGIIAGCYLIETILDRPDWGQVAFNAVVPSFSGPESILLATGILGATVMPHVIFLHSALTQGRIIVKGRIRLRRLFRFQVADVTIAMSIAGMVNAAMLIMAAATFYRHGLTTVGTIEEAHLTNAGQVIMQGFLHRQIPVWVRRLVTMLPSLVVIAWGLDPTRTLVISQVVLSFGIPFALVPLVMFTSRSDVMGVLVNHKITTIVTAVIAVLIIGLNMFLLFQTFFGS